MLKKTCFAHWANYQDETLLFTLHILNSPWIRGTIQEEVSHTEEITIWSIYIWYERYKLQGKSLYRGCSKGLLSRAKHSDEEKGFRAGDFNLSNATSDWDDLNVLDQGLNFTTYKGLNSFQMYVDVHMYIKKLSVK